MKTTVVNLKSEPYDIYIGRGGHGHSGYFGNPFVFPREPLDKAPRQPKMVQVTRATPIGYVIAVGSREESIENFKRYFQDRLENEAGFLNNVLSLRGKRLGCFCKPLACHGDVYVQWLEEQPELVYVKITGREKP